MSYPQKEGYDEYDDAILNAIARVLQDAEDERLPDDTIWYSDFCTLADALRNEIVNTLEEVDEQ